MAVSRWEMARASGLAFAAIALAAPAWAHHGFGRFDPTRDVELEGTLTGIDFVNPHAYLYFDGAAPLIAPSRAGHSLGRWDGDTLVVDTVGFAPGMLAAPVMNSDRLHVVERFTLDPETMALTRDYVAEDPVYYTDRYAGSDTVLPADAPFAEDRCEELTYRNYSEDASSNSAEPVIRQQAQWSGRFDSF